MFTGELKEVTKLNLSFGKEFPWSSTGGGDIWYVAGPIALLIVGSLVVVYSVISFFKKKKLKIRRVFSAAEARPDDHQFPFRSSSSAFDDVFFHHQQQQQVNNQNKVDEDGDVLLGAGGDDSKYAEELQVQEALLASMLHNPSSSSTHKPRSEILVCYICLENQEYWNMFTNSTCGHSFCYECTTKHATTKIQENNNTVTCPEFNCESTLDSTALRLIIPNHTLIKWDELVCESTILASHKLYCPFTTCSALLINDDMSITESDCPVCRRSICAVCRVPWHSDFTCKEFGKLSKKDYKMTQALAKKKKWRKCPKCKFFVEKSEGCLHITCRCKYEFCYRCGAKWSSNHGGCRRRG